MGLGKTPRGFKIPSETGGMGLPPKMGGSFRKSSKSGGISSPVEFGQKGMPVHKRPSGKHDPRMD